MTDTSPPTRDGGNLPSPRLLYRYEALTPDGRVLSGWFPDEATARQTFEKAAG